MKKFTTLLLSFSLLATLTVSFLIPAASAQSNAQAICEGSGGKWTPDNALKSGGSCASPDARTVPGTIQQVTDLMIFLVGAIAVLMIIIGGVRYVVSAGDQTALTSAKNTILYAIIGLLVAFMAYAIVHFVLGAFNIK